MKFSRVFFLVKKMCSILETILQSHMIGTLALFHPYLLSRDNKLFLLLFTILRSVLIESTASDRSLIAWIQLWKKYSYSHDFLLLLGQIFLTVTDTWSNWEACWIYHNNKCSMYNRPSQVFYLFGMSSW